MGWPKLRLLYILTGILIETLEYFYVHTYTGPSQVGGPGGPVPPHFLADQLTISQPGGGTLSLPSTTSPPGISDLATALRDY